MTALVAVCVGAAFLPGAAHADPLPGVATVTWGGSTVVLRQIEPPTDDDLADAQLVGVASEFSTVDPDTSCLNGDDINVWTQVGGLDDALVVANRFQAPQCVSVAYLMTTVDQVSSGLVCLRADCVAEMASFRGGQALQAASFQIEAALGEADSADELALGAAATATSVSLVDALAGEVAAQYDSLNGLWSSQFSTSLTNLDVRFSARVGSKAINVASPLTIDPSNAFGCLAAGCPLLDVVGLSGSARDSGGGGNQDPTISTARFNYYGGITPVYQRKGKHGVYGAVIYNWYAQEKKVSNDSDFWATSTSASVSPNDDSRLTRNYSGWHSNSNGVRMIQADPLTVQHSGAGETVTLSATLSGNVSAKKDGSGGDIGGQFGISRSYTRPEQNHGGGALSATGHYVLWETGDNGTGYGKEAAGVETWSIPTGTAIGWVYDAHANYCNNPCGA